MPLRPVEEPSFDEHNDDGQYFLFFASGSPSWCPDCREALPVIESVFGKEEAPVLQVILVGSREEWKTANNKWRVAAPFYVKETPCIIKYRGNKEVARLGDQACKSAEQLHDIVRAA